LRKPYHDDAVRVSKMHKLRDRSTGPWAGKTILPRVDAEKNVFISAYSDLAKHYQKILAIFLLKKEIVQLAIKAITAIHIGIGRCNMKGKSITKNGVIRGLSQNETMQLSQLLTSMQKQRINDGDSVLVKTEYIVDSWKEYWLGKEQEEEQDY
jgi:hypothetical protein